MSLKIRKWIEKRDLWLGIAGAIGLIVTGEWLASALLGEMVFQRWCTIFSEHPVFNIITALFLFFASFVLVFNYRRAFLLSRSFRYHSCKPHACLVMMLTLPSPDIQIPEGDLPWKLEKKDKVGNVKGDPVILEGQSLINDAQNLPHMWWNWQQLMRALIPHLNHLKEVRLIGSPNTKDKEGNTLYGSRAFAEKAKILIQTYFPSVNVMINEDAVNFEDFDALKNEMNDVLMELRSKLKYSEDEIIIDVTGGQKTASIAAAAVTLNSKMNFQYVRTLRFGDVPLNEDVMSYDVRVYSPLSEGG
ncbi:MAG: hypothetical protein JW943_10505 [Deltaproteobacteria bacterium]|nr:hypothetical protein [Deltaproteobacteria bacterium]